MRAGISSVPISSRKSGINGVLSIVPHFVVQRCDWGHRKPLFAGRYSPFDCGLKSAKTSAVPTGTRDSFLHLPSAEALGYDLSPLRGWSLSRSSDSFAFRGDSRCCLGLLLVHISFSDADG